jgi:hypothetical protein
MQGGWYHSPICISHFPHLAFLKSSMSMSIPHLLHPSRIQIHKCLLVKRSPAPSPHLEAVTSFASILISRHQRLVKMESR